MSEKPPRSEGEDIVSSAARRSRGLLGAVREHPVASTIIAGGAILTAGGAATSYELNQPNPTQASEIKAAHEKSDAEKAWNDLLDHAIEKQSYPRSQVVGDVITGPDNAHLFDTSLSRVQTNPIFIENKDLATSTLLYSSTKLSLNQPSDKFDVVEIHLTAGGDKSEFIVVKDSHIFNESNSSVIPGPTFSNEPTGQLPDVPGDGSNN